MSPRRCGSWEGLAVDELRTRWGRDSVHLYGTVDSTTTIARAAADEGAPGGTIILARAQRAGRGRGDHVWHSPEGAGLYLHMIFRPRTADVSPLATVLTGLGIATELARRVPGLRPMVKWPNDLIARDRKLGGILVEQSRSTDGKAQLVVGIGVNLDSDMLPAGVASWAIGVRQVADADLATVADAAIAGAERWLPEVPETLDEATLDELDRLDWLKGRRLAWSSPGSDPVRGTGAGIAPDGALLVRPDRGALRRVTTGTIDALQADEGGKG